MKIVCVVAYFNFAKTNICLDSAGLDSEPPQLVGPWLYSPNVNGHALGNWQSWKLGKALEYINIRGPSGGAEAPQPSFWSALPAKVKLRFLSCEKVQIFILGEYNK